MAVRKSIKNYYQTEHDNILVVFISEVRVCVSAQYTRLQYTIWGLAEFASTLVYNFAIYVASYPRPTPSLRLLAACGELHVTTYQLQSINYLPGFAS